MKAVTVRQPYASLIAAGVKTIETRPRRTGYRGRIAIHAGAHRPGGGWYDLDREPPPFDHCPDIVDRFWQFDQDANGTDYYLYRWRGPLGAVVASAVLTDCVSILAPGEPVAEAWQRHVAPTAHVPDRRLWLWKGRSETENLSTGRPTWVHDDITDQWPLGDFSPGRWALLLDDIKPTTERCPWCWGDGWLDDYQRDGCQVCGGGAYRAGAGTCDPVPARGQQAVPWEWHPKSPG